MPSTNDGSCPYCGCDTYHSLPGQEQRHPDLLPEDEVEWINRCTGCDGWSVNRLGSQFSLVDPNDPYSPKEI